MAGRLRLESAALTQADANALAWTNGVRLLERAIAERRTFAIETTLGGGTIPKLLASASDLRIAIRIWYIGLANPELHLARVRARVRKGGHDIAEADIRRRFETSRLNLIELLPKLSALRVFDNSREADPATGSAPTPRLILYMKGQRIVGPRNLRDTPDWAKPIVAAALRLSR